jgi:hypothetical protein
MTKPKIYVAGPYTIGDVALNVRAAVDAGEALLKAGFAPYVPHLSHFWHMLHPHTYVEWLAFDREWLRSCDALLLLPGESKGAEDEAQTAYNMRIPVFETVEQVIAYFQLGSEEA